MKHDAFVTDTPTPAAETGRTAVSVVTGLAGLFMLAAGVWCLVSPRTFAAVANFPPGLHYVADAGAFQLGIGASLLLALIWADARAVVLAGFLVANTAHAVNHALDLGSGGHGWDPWPLAALSVLVAIALVLRLRQLGWVVGEVTAATSPALALFVRQKTVLLTSWRRDGTPVGVPVSVAVDGGRGVLRSPGKGGKVRRMRNNPLVEIAPCTTRGTAAGPAIPARARQLEGKEARRAARLLGRKHPMLQGVMVPLTHRVFRARMGRTAYFELVPVDR